MKVKVPFFAAAIVAAFAAPTKVAQRCHALGERCAGADGKTFVDWSGCCGTYPEVDCLPLVGKSADGGEDWGRFCQSSVAKPKCLKTIDVPISKKTSTEGATSVSTPKPAASAVTVEPIAEKKDVAQYSVEEEATTAPTTKLNTNAARNPTTTAASKPVPRKHGGNPLAGTPMYVMPSFSEDCESSLPTAKGAAKESLTVACDTPTAFWLDKMNKVQSDNTSSRALAGVLQQAKGSGELVTFVVYDLPNRDCKAKASIGEICCKTNEDGTCDYFFDGKCDEGLAKYKKDYIDQIAISLAKYCDTIPIALIVEPDSLANLVTNMDDPKCGNSATKSAYESGIRYAVETLHAACPAATMYLDAAHGGWLGWKDNLAKFAALIKSMDVHSMLRGFALNVANYQSLGLKCPSVGYCLNCNGAENPCCEDPCGLSTKHNVGHNEMNYAAALAEEVKSVMPDFDAKMVIDTGRNGQNSARTNCSIWCNARNAGYGAKPTTETKSDHVDALLWIKTPGESDGCTEELPNGGTCPRFDADCASDGSIGTDINEPRAPEAGGWFDYQVQMLALNANM